MILGNLTAYNYLENQKEIDAIIYETKKIKEIENELTILLSRLRDGNILLKK